MLRTPDDSYSNSRHAGFNRFRPQGSTILTICNELPGQLSSDKLAGKAVLLVWDAASPDYPVNVLVGDGNPTCASFSPNQNFIVFAGTEDGNLLVWDLREARTAQTIEVRLRALTSVCVNP